MVTNKEKINILINKYKKYVKTILNASPDEVEKLNSLSDTEAFNYLKKLEDGEEKELLSMKPADIKKLGVALSFVPEDRLGMGLVGSMGMTGNILF